MLAVRLPEAVRARAESADPLQVPSPSKAPPSATPAYHVNAGDTITIDVPEAVAAEPSGEDIALI